VKKYILMAGVNGAAKSTLYQLNDNWKDMKRVNTDKILREFVDLNYTKALFGFV